jgi:hypothetical protein
MASPYYLHDKVPNKTGDLSKWKEQSLCGKYYSQRPGDINTEKMHFVCQGYPSTTTV